MSGGGSHHIYRSPSHISIPRDVNLTELLHMSACNPPLPLSHLIAKDNLTNRSLTLGELRSHAGRLAQGFTSALNSGDKDRWGIILPNSVDYWEAFHAVLWASGTVCPINHALKASEIAHALCVTRPKYLIVYGIVLGKVRNAVSIARERLRKQNVSWDRPQIITVLKKVKGYKHIPDDLMAETSLPIPHWNNTTTRLASIHLSSGTTGPPKGAELTHYNFIANCYQLYKHDPKHFNRSSRTVAYTPFVHIGMTTLPLFMGPWTGIMHHAMPSFDLDVFGQLVQSNAATTFQGVPSVILSIANSDICEKYDFSSAKVIYVGGIPFKQDLLDKLSSRAPWKVIQIYGMTEAAPYVAVQRFDEAVPEGAVGYLLPNIEAALKQENTTVDAPRGGPGELWLKGPNIFGGYAFDDEASERSFPVPMWYNTGDICTITEDGFISVVGRAKELIKYKGFQISPVELEAHLNSHHFVADAAVGSVWDESQLTELPVAYVVLKPQIKPVIEKQGALLTIHRDVDGEVSGYKKLRGGVWEVAAVVRNPTGKILRKQLPGQRTGLCSTMHMVAKL